jgi:hypothetical protein
MRDAKEHHDANQYRRNPRDTQDDPDNGRQGIGREDTGNYQERTNEHRPDRNHDGISDRNLSVTWELYKTIGIYTLS